MIKHFNGQQLTGKILGQSPGNHGVEEYMDGGGGGGMGTSTRMWPSG